MILLQRQSNEKGVRIMKAMLHGNMVKCFTKFMHEAQKPWKRDEAMIIHDNICQI